MSACIRLLHLLIVGVAILFVMAGCDILRGSRPTPGDPGMATASPDDLRRLVVDQQLRIERLNQDLGHTERALRATRRELQAVQAQIEGVMEARKQDAREFNVTDVVFGMLTSCASFDDRPGDDGVIAYVYPVDDHGDTIKRAGSFEFTVFDFLADGEPVVARGAFGPETNRQHWISFPSAGYRFRIPWDEGPPILARKQTARDLMIRVVFRDLDGRVYKASRKITYRSPEAHEAR